MIEKNKNKSSVWINTFFLKSWPQGNWSPSMSLSVTLYFPAMNHSILKDSHPGAIFITVTFTFTFLFNFFFLNKLFSYLKLREYGFKIMRDTRFFFSFSFIFQFIYIVAYDFRFFFFLFIKPIEYPLMNTFSMFVCFIIQLFKEELNWMPNVLLV